MYVPARPRRELGSDARCQRVPLRVDWFAVPDLLLPASPPSRLACALPGSALLRRLPTWWARTRPTWAWSTTQRARPSGAAAATATALSEPSKLPADHLHAGSVAGRSPPLRCMPRIVVDCMMGGGGSCACAHPLARGSAHACVCVQSLPGWPAEYGLRCRPATKGAACQATPPLHAASGCSGRRAALRAAGRGTHAELMMLCMQPLGKLQRGWHRGPPCRHD